MAYRTEDGVRPPEEWKLAVALPGGIGNTGGAVAVMDQRSHQALIIQAGSVDAAYWLACLINDGLGVGEDDPEPS